MKYYELIVNGAYTPQTVPTGGKTPSGGEKAEVVRGEENPKKWDLGVEGGLFWGWRDLPGVWRVSFWGWGVLLVLKRWSWGTRWRKYGEKRA